jgi:hydroxymethylpyrimidine pyrophosphatase-like HAD family hydrolase
MAAQAAGLEVVLVTGRSWRGTQAYYQALDLQRPAICYLGALVVDGLAGRILHHRPLAEPAWAAVKRLALAEGLSVTACVGADLAVEAGSLPDHDLIALDTAFATCRAEDFADWEGWNTYTEMAPDLAPCTAPPTMAAVYGDRAVQRVLQAFPTGLPDSQFDLTDKVKGETVLHIWHSEVDKGRSLAHFCRARGIPPEAVAAIGDAPMDLSMIEFAGLGVCVPDGHPLLKAAAQLVAEPVEAIRQILKG